MGCCRGCCCSKAAIQVDGQSDSSDEAFTRPPRKCRCFRKFLAITCSQLGLLVFIILYLIGGSYLFNYLEREQHQSRLNQEIMDVKTSIDDITDSMGRVKRSLYEEISPKAQQIGLQCIDFQIETLLKEIDRLQRRIIHEHLKSRGAEIRQLQQEVSDLKNLGEIEQLEKSVDQALNINFSSQIKTYERFLRPTRTSVAFSDVPSEKLNNLMRHVYNAIKAGWVLPPVSADEGQLSISTPSVNSRSRLAPSTTPPSILNSRMPRSDPWTLSGSLFYVITVITTIGKTNNVIKQLQIYLEIPQ